MIASTNGTRTIEPTTTIVPQTKIDHAISAILWLIQGFHRPGLDRGALLSFGSKLRVECDFETSQAPLKAAAQSLSYANRNERTRYYDSVADAVAAFRRAGRRTVPWVLMSITDGSIANQRCLRKTRPAAGSTFVATSVWSPATTWQSSVSVAEKRSTAMLSRALPRLPTAQR